MTEQSIVSNGSPDPRASVSLGGMGVIGSLLLVVLAWVVVWYWPTAVQIASIWWTHETFSHGLIVFPVFAWLIWLRRKDLAGSVPEPIAWMSLPVAVAGLGWLVSEFITVNALSHLALMTALVLAFVGVLGWSLSRQLAFPLGFLFFGVPIGEFLIPVLMDYTAIVTVWALRMTGIPVYQEDLFFVIPTGQWSVVAACSGIRYLVASVMLGTLFAYLNYQSLTRRLIFVGFSIVVPIFANWMRAYMIVMIGHLTNNRLAAGVDHLLYGWVFFGIVIGLMFWIGLWWREDRAAPATPAALVTVPPREISLRSVAARVLPILVVLAAFPIAQKTLDASVEPFEVVLQPPEPGAAWSLVNDSPLYDYQPRFRGQRGTLYQTYRHAEGDLLVLYVAYYAEQRPGTQLITSSNRLNFREPTGPVNWQLVSSRAVEMPTGPILRTMIADRQRILAAWHWYWSNGAVETSELWAKITYAINRMTGRSDDAAFVAVLIPAADRTDDSRDRVAEFLEDHGPAIEKMLRQAQARR